MVSCRGDLLIRFVANFRKLLGKSTNGKRTKVVEKQTKSRESSTLNKLQGILTYSQFCRIDSRKAIYLYRLPVLVCNFQEVEFYFNIAFNILSTIECRRVQINFFQALIHCLVYLLILIRATEPDSKFTNTN